MTDSARKLVLICGVYRSGSTWSFNVVRETALRLGLSVDQAPDYRHVSPAPVDVRLLKFHEAPQSAVDEFLRLGDRCKVVVTHRSPESCIGSMMRTFDQSFDEAFDSVRGSFAFAASLRERALVVDYRNIVRKQTLSTFRLIRYAYGLPAAVRCALPVSNATRREKMAKISERLRKDDPHAVALGDMSYYDSQTFLHRRHVTPDEIDYRSLLTPEQLRRIDEQIPKLA